MALGTTTMALGTTTLGNIMDHSEIELSRFPQDLWMIYPAAGNFEVGQKFPPSADASHQFVGWSTYNQQWIWDNELGQGPAGLNHKLDVFGFLTAPKKPKDGARQAFGRKWAIQKRSSESTQNFLSFYLLALLVVVCWYVST